MFTRTHQTQVEVTGTFNNWGERIPMQLDPTDLAFKAKVRLQKGQEYQYKFVIDGNWRCNPAHPQADDGSGNKNNTVTL